MFLENLQDCCNPIRQRSWLEVDQGEALLLHHGA